ncbi:MAG: Ku protein [Acidimicrobiaceae bacterium]|nr:Ku protein [Acidimicrobiaceae bacterium]MYC43791.1 Ku protein [Acidimicrobiaceae bacterium]MYH87331.1 Ku protein [Acidimicrobiaceae bacterium]
MPRAIWSGSISFGLVNIPVRLFTAVRRKTVRFNQIDSSTGARVRQKLVSAADGEEVPKERIVKGYALDDGDYVTVSEEEMTALDPDMARTIDIDEFIDLSDIDPIFYDNAYYLVPGDQASKPYKLLATAMEEAQKVGICHFVMRSKRYLAAVRPVEGRLLLSTMVYHDEIVDHGEIDGFDALADIEIDEREQAMAQQLIATLDSTFDPTRHSDTYREAVLELIERKAAGERSDDLMRAPAPSSDKVIDLMAALEASVNEAKKARKRHPAAGLETGRKAGRSKAAEQNESELSEPSERTA